MAWNSLASRCHALHVAHHAVAMQMSCQRPVATMQPPCSHESSQHAITMCACMRPPCMVPTMCACMRPPCMLPMHARTHACRRCSRWPRGGWCPPCRPTAMGCGWGRAQRWRPPWWGCTSTLGGQGQGGGNGSGGGSGRGEFRQGGGNGRWVAEFGGTVSCSAVPAGGCWGLRAGAWMGEPWWLFVACAPMCITSSACAPLPPPPSQTLDP